MNPPSDGTPLVIRRKTWLWPGLGLLALLLGLCLLVRDDLSTLRWVAELSQQGSPAPATDAAAPAGYVRGQHHFLGYRERGETYRWIAEAQTVSAEGFFPDRDYKADNTPSGRRNLQPRLYAWWLAGIGRGLHALTGTPLPLAIEQAALWEPVLVHAAGFLLLVTLFWLRFGPACSLAAGSLLALSPLMTAQFLPGSLSCRPLAWILTVCALSLHMPRPAGASQGTTGFGLPAAILTAGALWLSPIFGFPILLISALIGLQEILLHRRSPSALTWSLIGSVLCLGAWLADQSPWDPMAGELRYLHPTYAVAWLGIGLLLHGVGCLRQRGTSALSLVWLITGVLCTAVLPGLQLYHHVPGWLHSSAAMLRVNSLDESIAHPNLLAWLKAAAPVEICFIAAPVLLPLCGAGLVLAFRRSPELLRKLGPALILALGCVLLAGMQIRWAIPTALLLLPLFWLACAEAPASLRPAFPLGFALLSVVFFLAQNDPSSTLRRPSGQNAPSAPDAEALVYRHCAHWLVSHSGDSQVSALAPPELSDSLVFHGNCRVLMSTAWESYQGQVAAARILSAPESSEVEEVLQSREVTHLVIPSWDAVLPMLVKAPGTDSANSLYDRLQHWVYPGFLRPIPYHLPSMDGYLDKKLTVFQVIPTEDQGLALSRLAEYFVEMNRGEPAGLVAKVLTESYPDDPNALVARATVHASMKDAFELPKELQQLEKEAGNPDIVLPWDRRVQRAIILALGHRHRIAKLELGACLEKATRETIQSLTPLEAHRLQILAKTYHLHWADQALAPLLDSQGAEYHTTTPEPAST